jgi:hypothetical protein
MVSLFIGYFSYKRASSGLARQIDTIRTFAALPDVQERYQRAGNAEEGDSSNFPYIAHLPVIVALEILLLDVPLPPLAKIALVLAVTNVLLLPVYHYGVRPTLVGAVLNGRRYPPQRVAVATA